MLTNIAMLIKWDRTITRVEEFKLICVLNVVRTSSRADANRSVTARNNLLTGILMGESQLARDDYSEKEVVLRVSLGPTLVGRNAAI